MNIAASFVQVVEESVRFLCTAEDSSLEANAKKIAPVFSYLLWNKSLAEEEELHAVFQAGVDRETLQVYSCSFVPRHFRESVGVSAIHMQDIASNCVVALLIMGCYKSLQALKQENMHKKIR